MQKHNQWFIVFCLSYYLKSVDFIEMSFSLCSRLTTLWRYINFVLLLLLLLLYIVVYVVYIYNIVQCLKFYFSFGFRSLLDLCCIWSWSWLCPLVKSLKMEYWAKWQNVQITWSRKV